MEAFSAKGHEVWLLGWGEKGLIHQNVEKFGVKTEVHTVPGLYYGPLQYFWYTLKLVSFVRQNKIDLVYSHTQPVNFVSVFAQFFSSARFIICRHHSDYIMNGSNRNAKKFDEVINKLGREFIVPSKKVFDQITRVEGVNPEKVRLINYAYHFERYPVPDARKISEIKKEFPTALLLCAVSRFIPCKRYDVMIRCVSDLINEGHEIKLIMLGNGPLEEEMRNLVNRLSMQEHIHFIGFTTEVMTYMAASDMVVHFSDSEASNSVIKEAGLLEKIVVVCDGVGDFSEYIQNYRNGFILDKAQPCPAFKDIIRKIKVESMSYEFLGAHLRQAVLTNFEVNNVIHHYKEVL